MIPSYMCSIQILEYCGHRIHVLFMMYDVYWYCQMKKNEWLWKFWKRNDLYANFEKRGVVEKRGQEETKSMPHAPVITVIHTCIRITYWRRDDWPFIYFVIFVSMDEKIECRSLYFLVSILRGIICIVIVVITHTHIILASRWRFKMHTICFMNN